MRWMDVPARALIAAVVVGAVTSSVGATTADHSTYEVLQQEFQSAPEVTEACLTCHVHAADQVMDTIHWTWVCPKSVGSGHEVGKAHVINNFCIAVQSNEARCTSCHAGYGWRDESFDFSDRSKVDCLICHDTTGTYKKFPTGAGHPTYQRATFGGKEWLPPDLNTVAQNVGSPSRENCGSCHFYGGGGEGVKHADLDTSLYTASRELDVHMAADGEDFSCQTCHTTKSHNVAGRCYASPAVDQRTFQFPQEPGDTSHIYCQSCHGNAPHDDAVVNNHLDTVACQSCHIPRASRGKASKYWWDWSEAGKLDDNGAPFRVTDEEGRVIYDTKKGAFRWEKDVVPEYYWFNGTATNTLLHHSIDDSEVVQINSIGGAPGDPSSRIWPFKVHRGRQPYDPVNSTLVVPHLYGPKGSGAFWADLDWDTAIRTGMESVAQPYSGRYAFVETEMYWPITHQVAPADMAVSCEECHSESSRLASLEGIYMPGHHRSGALDLIGWSVSGLALIGVVIHGGLRAALPRLRRRRSCGAGDDDRDVLGGEV